MSSTISAVDIANWLVVQIATHEHIEPSNIDIQAPFSSYGLGSMAAIRISGDLEQWLGRRLSPTLIYDYPSIESLAHYLAYGTPLQDAVVEVNAHQGAMTEAVAIIGLGCRFPGSANPEAFWCLLSHGEDAIREVPADRWGAHAFDHLDLDTSEKLQASRGGFLEQVDLFDPHFFGISPSEAISMDPQQRLLLEVAWETLEDAGQAPEHLAGSQTGIFLGISNNDYGRLQANLADYIDLYDATGNAFSIAANRLSYLLDVRGPSLVVDTACSSSLVAVHLACQSLRAGEATLALAGGVNLILSPDLTVTFAHGQMVASDGHCKTFDVSADGYVRSEGCGFVALKLLSNALRDGDQILATIRGSAVNQDGRSNGLTAPNGPAQQAVIRQALHNAHVTPGQIGYVEAHGSGTALGDPIEMQALEGVLSERIMEDGFCLVGSVKTNIGHLEAAAGIAGLIKAVLALQHQQIPAHLHLKNLNPRIHFTGNCIAIPTELYTWPKEEKRRRFAGVSSFGLGGTNAHVVLEEAPERVLSLVTEDRPLHLFALSAKSDTALRKLADSYVQFLASHNERIEDICFTANVGRSHFAQRFITTVSSSEQLQEKLHTFALEEKSNIVQTEAVSAGEKPKIAFLYTGQGSQYVGMGYHLYATQPTFRRAINQCAEILHPFLKVPLLSLLHPRTGTPFLLEQSQYNQPVLFALEYALTQLWKSWGVEPDAVLGYGPGEYTAACVAGVFSLEDGLKLVAKRGKLMQSLEQQEEIESNSDAFHQTAHSVHFFSPEPPFISSVTGQQIQAGTLLDAFYWQHHLNEPDQFSDGARTLEQLGCQTFIELGPKSHLLALGKSCFAEGFGTWLPSLMLGQDDWECILNGLGTLYMQGRSIDWAAFDQDYARFRISLPTYPFEKQRYWKMAPVEITRDTATQEQSTLPTKPSRYETILSMLTTIASKPLQMDPAKIDTQALFLEMGVNSLVLLEVMRTVEKTFGVKLEILDFFDDLTTLDALAAYVEQKSSLNVEPIDQLSSLAVPAPVRQATVSQTVLEEEHDEPNEKSMPVAGLEQIMAKQLEVMAQQLEILQRTSQDIALLMREVKAMRAENLQPDPPSSPSPGSGRPQESIPPDEEKQSADRLVVSSGAVPSQKEENSPVVQESSIELPLLDVQKQFWVLSQVGDEFSACYERMLELHGPLDVDVLYQAFQQVVDRHEALRISISADGNGQYIHQQVSFSLPIVDFSQVPVAEHTQKVERWLSEEHQRGFDLTRAPLFRAHILKLAEHIHILVLSVHHIIIDGQSFYVLLQEVSALYSALVSNTECHLPPAMLFRNYIQSQMQHYQSPQGIANEAYWIEQFADPLPVLELPIDHVRPLVKTYSGARQSIVIETEMLSRLKVLSKERESTLFMLLLTAYAVLLHRLAGQDDVIVGIPFAGHTLGGDEHLIGSSADIIPIWSCVADNPTFVEALATLKQRLLKAYEHQPYTLASLIQHLKQSGDRSRTPVVSTTFNQNPNISMPAMGKLETRLLAMPVWHTVYEISINIVETNRTLEIDFDYNTDTFDPQTLSRMQGYFITLLESIVAQPGLCVADLPILTPVEQKQLLLDWNATTTNSQELCVHHLFEQQVRQTPDAVALVFEQAHMTYQQLSQRTNQLAQYLHRLGAGPEAMVGVCLENSLEMAVGVLGVLKAGATVMPIDPAAPKERLSFLFADARLTLLLTLSRLREVLPDSQATTVLLDRDWGVIAQENTLQPAYKVNPESLVYVIYTSGSTGMPKGVSLPHRVLGNLLLWHRSQLLGGVRTLQFAPLSFDASFHELFAAWCSGGTLCLMTAELRRDVVGLAHFLVTQAIEKTILPVVMLHQLAQEYTSQHYEITHLKEILATGEQLQITQPVIQMFAALEHCTLHNHYGPSESHVVTAYTLPGNTHEWPTHPPIGRPIANTQIYVLDASLNPVPIGSVGELYIGGLSLARGYLDRPALTAERFLPHPFASSPGGARVYKTGDQARYRADGTIEYLGRRDQQVKIRGYRIELGEIEAALGKLPTVRDAVVVAREIQGETRPVAYMVGSERLTVRDVRRSLQNTLPDYMLPAHVVWLERIPLTSNGKVDRKGLPNPGALQEDSREASQDARTPLEELLQEVWREVLGRHQIGIYDNFFEVGGHSLLATQLIARFRTLFAVEVPVRMLFEHPTIAAVAQQIEHAMSRNTARPMPALVVGERPAEIPLSFAQQRLWFLDQLEPGSTAYLLPGILRVSGEVDVRGLEWVMQELTQRHESLRTIFVERSGQPVQVILPARTYTLPVIDLQGLGHEQAEMHASWLTHQESLHPYDLAKGPLVRTTLLRLGRATHILLLTLHHIITDAWSNGILMQDFTLLYQAALRGEPSPLVPLPIQYADYALWQREWLQEEELEAQLAYWRMQLMDVAPLELPTDYPRPAMQMHRGVRRRYLFSASLSEQMVALSRQHNVTLFMLLVASFQIVLVHYTEQHDISVGTPIANRRHAGLEGVVGFFLNTLVLRTDLSGDPTFEEVLHRVREMCLNAYAHQDIPFEKVVEELVPERDMSRSPFFQVLMVLQNTPSVQFELGEGRVTLEAGEAIVSHFDLTLFLTEMEQGLECILEYDTDLFEAETIERLWGHWQTLLEGIVHNPQGHLSVTSLLTSGERERLLVEWNATQRGEPLKPGMHQLFEQQVLRTPDALAVVCEHVGLTYWELNRQANQLAHHLQQMGVCAEMLVGVCMERSAEVVIALLALFKVGAVYVPLDPSYPVERLTQIAEDAQFQLILTQDRVASRLIWATALVVCIDTERFRWCNEREDNLERRNATNELAYIIYTSGSTGKPKGAMIEQQGMLNHLFTKIEDLTLTRGDRVAQTASLSFDISVWQLLSAFLLGGCTVIYEREVVSDPSQLIRRLQSDQISIVELVPTLLQALLESVELWSPLERSLLSLRWVVPTGEALSPALCRRWFTIYPEIPLLNAYGPTECSDDVASHAILQAPGPQMLVVPIGRPVSNIRLYVLDTHQMLVPIGITGELFVGGVGVGRGYLNDPQRTATIYVPDPFVDEPGQRLYKTGDQARYQADGTLEFLGRIDQQVKIRGFRIELGEIEAVLDQHPTVRKSVVLAQDDPFQNKRLVAYVVPAQPENLTPALLAPLRQYLQERLPEYLIPAAFVPLSALPLNANGKIDRRAFVAPEIIEEERQQTQQGARTPLEELLLDLWCEVLGRQQIGIYDNFFDLGGHSLLATRLISRIKATLEIEMPLRAIFQTPTVESLAQGVEQSLQKGGAIQMPPLVVGVRPEKIPLSFAQQRMWFLDQLDPGNTAYLLPSAFSVSGEIDVCSLERALEEMIRRHESLRTTFVEKDGQPIQVIGAAGLFPLPIIDLERLGHRQAEVYVQWLARQDAHHSFDLTRGPLLRTVLLRLDDTAHILLFTLHHIITDGWSNAVLVQELTVLYQSIVAGQALPLLPLPIQYADYTLWQRQWLQSEVLAAQIAYWRIQLAAVAPLALPTDHPRPAVQTHWGTNMFFQFSPALSEQLVALSQQQHVTLFMLLLATFQMLLARYSGQCDISVGSPIANRRHMDLEGVIGFFANTLVLRTDLSGDPTFVQVLQRVREVCLGAYTHQDIPFEKVVQELSPERDLSRSPLFQVLFVLQNVLQKQADLTRVTIKPLMLESSISKFDLTLSIEETGQGLYGTLEYNTDLFERETITRMLGHWRTLLEDVVHSPYVYLSEVALLTPAERELLLVEWNATQTTYTQQGDVHELFEQQVQQTPEAVALVFEEQQLTYAQLNNRANQVAHHLQAVGVGAEVLVGIYMERSVEMVIGLLGVLKAGGAYVPLDPSYPEDRVAYMIEDCQPVIILTQARFRSRLPFSEVLSLDTVWEEWIRGNISSNPGKKFAADHLAYLIYTSGSTGRPKGVMNTQHGLRNRLLWMQQAYSLTPRDRVLQKTPFSFDVSVWEFFWPLVTGACLVMALPGGHQDPTYIKKVLVEQQITTLHFVPAMLLSFLQEPGVEACRSVRQVISSGEALTAELQTRFFAHFSAEVGLQNLYGPTEASIDVTFWACKLEQEALVVPIGHPIANTQIHILDTSMRPVPIGVAGELYIGGVGLARGYNGRADLTAEKFVANPFSWRGSERLYKTGDLARYRHDGVIEYLGRIDLQVKLRGFRIELGEIEAVLQAHPVVEEGVVLAREDVPGNQRLVAYVVAQPGQELGHEELRNHLQACLPSYMIPSAFVFLEVLPLTSNGKVDRNMLPSPEMTEGEQPQVQQEARTPQEELLLSLWREVLDRRQVGIHGNFFELGGHSLLATRLMARVRAILGIEVPLLTLFEAPTVASFAHRLGQIFHDDEEIDLHMAYWRTQLADASSLALPTDYIRPTMQTYQVARLPFQLSMLLSEQLVTLSQEEHVTLFMVLLASFQVLLACYSGQHDISVGTAITNRHQTEVEGVIGFSANTLVMRTDLSGDPTFQEVLQRVRNICMGAYAHQNVPFEKVMEELVPKRDLSRSPLFQVMLILQNIPQGSANLSEEQESVGRQFDLTLSLRETQQGLSGVMEYSTDLFEAETISRILIHWQIILEWMVCNQHVCISEVPLLTDAERDLLLNWNTTRTIHDQERSIHQIFEEQVQRTPEAMALTFEEQQVTYARLNRRANQLARHLRELGVSPEDLVGICMERSLEQVITVLAVLKAGGAYVPFDASNPQERLAFLLTHTGIVVLITQSHIREHLPAFSGTVLCIDQEIPMLAQLAEENLECVITDENAAYVIYTSGSTGTPKGVVVAHRSLVQVYHSWEEAYQLRAAVMTHLQMANFSFDVFTGDWIRALCSGSKLAICPRNVLLDPPQLFDLLRREQVEIAEFVPIVLRNLVSYLQEKGQCIDFLKLVAAGADTWYMDDFVQLQRVCGTSTRLINSYGLTEATIDNSYYEYHEGSPAAGGVMIGRPLATTQVYLLDRSMQLVPLGIAGEMYLGGVCLSRGYLHQPAITAERMCPNPWSREPGARLYKTGDLARYRRDGNLEFLGRKDQQVKVRGHRIELGEVEATLQAHPSIEGGVVLMREDVAGDKRLVAYVVPQAEEELTREEVRTFLQDYLPGYMLPSAFVFLDALPLTPNGKVDRNALPPPHVTEAENQQGQQQARTPQEELLLNLWREVLDHQQIGIHDNFFEWGGHSLLATRLIARVRAILGVEVPLLALFEAPTVAEFVPWLDYAFHESNALQMPPLVAGVRPEQLPLSFAQQRLWFLDQLEPGNIAYLLPGAFSVSGKIDTRNLERAMEDLIRRHESLRTTFTQREGQPMQVIHPASPPVFPLIDLQGLGHMQAQMSADLVMHEEAQCSCDLAMGPLVRMSLLRLEENVHILLLTLHHIITDGWSDSVLLRELTMLYQTHMNGQPSGLAPLPIQYVDYALWQRSWLQGEVLEAQMTYWRTQLADGSPLELPTDHPRPAVQMNRGAGWMHQFSVALSQQLVSLSRQQNVTLFMLLLASFQMLLARYSGQHDICVGTPIANRRHADLEGVVGFFLNTLVMRTDLSGDPTFEQVLRRVLKVCLEAYSHQDVPFEKVVEELAPERDLSRTPLFQVLLVLQNTPPGELGLGEGRIKPLVGRTVAGSFDLAFFLTETEHGLECYLDYNPDLFEEETIVRLLDHWQNLLQEVVNNAQVHLSEVPLLTQDERTRLLVDWNATQRTYPQDHSMHQLFEQQVQYTPDTLAVVHKDVCLTYQELNRRANQLAHYLQRQGVEPETLVGVCMERSPELLIALLALFKAGGVYVPLDPSDPTERLAWIGEDAQFLLILTQERVASMLPWTHIPFLYVDAEYYWWSDEHRSNLANRLTRKNLAYVIYTSGSTGRPKGAMIEQQGMLNHLFTKIEDVMMTSADRVAQTASVSFDISVWQLLSALLVGGCTVIYDREVVSEPLQLVERLQTDQISIVELVPTLLQALLESVEPLMLYERSLPSVRWMVPTGEALSPALARHWFTVYPEIPLLNAYGPTECSDDVASYALLQLPDPQALQVPIGHPVGNMRLYVLDAHQRVLPIGIAGELYVGGVGVGRGYLNDAQRTAATYIPDPFAEEPGQRLYKTGDRVRTRRDGALEFLGRIDQQVKIRGYRIELGEIEAALREHEAIQEAVVLAREETTGEKRLIAYLVLRSGERLSGKEVRTFLQNSLPSYMLPWTSVFLDTLPLTPNGKVDRRALPATEEVEDEMSSMTQEARTPLEELLLGLWREVLNRQQIGMYDNFFELGGYSLLAVQLIVRIRTMLAIEVPLRVIFEEPTIASFAQWIEHAQRKDKGTQMPPLLAGVRPEKLPLSFAQQRLWFLDQLESGSTTYLDPSVLHIRGKIDVYALERALEALMHRHESLRTTFAQRVGSPLQVIHPASPLSFPVIDLQGLEHEQAEVHASRLAHQEAQCPCDLARGPLMRITLLWLAKHEYMLLLTLHHIITDGLSTGVLVHELTTLYKAMATGQPSPLLPLAIQYADYALWQRQWLQGEVLQQHLEYWRKQLWRVQTLALPVDALPSVVRTNRGASYSFTLSPNLSAQLLLLSRQENVTLFMLLLAAFQVLLYHVTNQEDIVIGTDVANRNHKETEGLIGFFVNQLVLRSHVTGNQTFRELFYQVRNMTLDAYLHQDIPFEKLVEVLLPERKTQATPYFSVKMLLESSVMERSSPQDTLALLDITLDSLSLSDETALDLDLILRFFQSSEGIQGTFDYRADLFEQATIERMAQHLLTVLEHMCMNQDERLNAFEVFKKKKKDKVPMQRKARKETISHQLKKIRPQAVHLYEEQLVRTEYLDKQNTLPLVISPQMAELTLSAWADNNRAFLETELYKHGALLFRGFHLPTPADFERFAAVLCSDLFHENGEHVAVKNVGDGHLYTPVFYAPDKKLLWHHENSFNAEWPMRILFHCAQPAEQGGETPIVDSRNVFQLLDPALKKPFSEKGILYVRTYTEGLGLSWQTVFRTTDKREVEARCQKEAIAFEWKEGDRLTTRQVRPAVLQHPQTGEMVWWNQAPHWHPACLEPEVRASLSTLFAPEDLPRNCFYGDGSPIEDHVMKTICDVYQKAEISFPWQTGDILVLDNMLIAHARNPYQGTRKIYVSMGNMMTLQDL